MVEGDGEVDHGGGRGDVCTTAVTGGGPWFGGGAGAARGRAAAPAFSGIFGPGVPGQRGLHGPRELGDGPGRGCAVWLRADLGLVDVQPDGRAVADAGGTVGGGDGSRPGA